MLPTQILLNNFLYHLATTSTISTDNVDASYIQRPQRWDMRVIRDFMIFIGPISPDFRLSDVLRHAADLPRQPGLVSYRVVR